VQPRCKSADRLWDKALRNRTVLEITGAARNARCASHSSKLRIFAKHAHKTTLNWPKEKSKKRLSFALREAQLNCRNVVTYLYRSASAGYILRGRLIVMSICSWGANPSGMDTNRAALSIKRPAAARSARDNITLAPLLAGCGALREFAQIALGEKDAKANEATFLL